MNDTTNTRYHVMTRRVVSNDGDVRVINETSGAWPQGLSYSNAKHRQDHYTDAIGAGVILACWLIEAEQA
jgi:hypothetical protein